MFYPPSLSEAGAVPGGYRLKRSMDFKFSCNLYKYMLGGDSAVMLLPINSRSLSIENCLKMMKWWTDERFHQRIGKYQMMMRISYPMMMYSPTVFAWKKMMNKLWYKYDPLSKKGKKKWGVMNCYFCFPVISSLLYVKRQVIQRQKLVLLFRRS